MTWTKRQTIAAGGIIGAIIVIASGAVAWDNRKRNFRVKALGCDVDPAKSYYIKAWKDPIADPIGRVNYQVGICNAISCGLNQCVGVLPLERGYYRIAVFDNQGYVYYSKDINIVEDMSIEVDVAVPLGNISGTTGVPAVLPEDS